LEFLFRHGGQSERVELSRFTLVLVCVSLAFLASAAQVLHAHPITSVAPDHTCTICSVAHAGIIIAPVFSFSIVLSFLHLLAIPQASARPLLTFAGLYVRPPPSV
jgi:hypothetical protein